MSDERCDYCGEELGDDATIRIVGYTTLGGSDSVPLAKLHCGNCETPDDIDPAAVLDFWMRRARSSQQDQPAC